jgi:septal ring factor EnvC (AmiA/AmiB activator)
MTVNDGRARIAPMPTPASNRQTRLAAAVALALLAGVGAGRAQTPAESPDAALSQQRDATAGEFEQVTREITLSHARIAAIEAEIASIAKDEQSLTAALIQAAKTERKLSEDVAATGERVEALELQRGDLLMSLADRRALLAEVLAALQRMGLNPPPAMLVSPEDALGSVRSAILLGSVVPEMRAEMELLVADLAELERLTASITEERTRLLATMADQAAEKERLTLLSAEKAKVRAETQEMLAYEQTRAGELASRAGSLRELIETMETEITAQRAARERQARESEVPAPVPEANRLAAAQPFDVLKGKLVLPVSGVVARRFGAKDDAGSSLFGDIVATHSGAIVTAPSDGAVLYAGPFRSYGQLLILDAGGGYHVVLAGLGRISVSLGQAVLAGEPVGTMGESGLASAVSAGRASEEPELYVEFRKDGQPVDPAPWWAVSLSGRTANGT